MNLSTAVPSSKHVFTLYLSAANTYYTIITGYSKKYTTVYYTKQQKIVFGREK